MLFLNKLMLATALEKCSTKGKGVCNTSKHCSINGDDKIVLIHYL